MFNLNFISGQEILAYLFISIIPLLQYEILMNKKILGLRISTFSYKVVDNSNCLCVVVNITLLTMYDTTKALNYKKLTSIKRRPRIDFRILALFLSSITHTHKRNYLESKFSQYIHRQKIIHIFCIAGYVLYTLCCGNEFVLSSAL